MSKLNHVQTSVKGDSIANNDNYYVCVSAGQGRLITTMAGAKHTAGTSRPRI